MRAAPSADYTAHLLRGWKKAPTTAASNRTVQYRWGGSDFVARSQTTTFQSREAERRKRELRDHLFGNLNIVQYRRKHTYDRPVIILTWPSRFRTTAWVARSHKKTLPSRRPAAANRPVQSKRAITAPESSVARTVDGRFCVSNGSGISIS